jgi:chaperonin GroES
VESLRRHDSSEIVGNPVQRVLRYFQAPLAGRKIAAHIGAKRSTENTIGGPSQQQTLVSSKSWEDNMKFRPLHDRVVVKRIDAEEKSAGGIIIPDTAKEKPSQGEVVAVGPGGRDEAGKLIPIDIKVGDRVLFGKWSGTEVKIDGQELLIMKESDIMGIIDEPVAKKKAA